MKRFFGIVILFIGSLFFVGCTSLSDEKINKDNEVQYNYESIKDEIIRFHVIANSDNKKDQDLKLKVRNEVIKFIEPLLNKSKSIEESRKIIKSNNEKIIKIAKKVVKENGYNYEVKGNLSKENFPEKEYGNIVFPQGEYEAYRILIGKASGQNWWCVMFPPLCFVDVTKGEVAYNETEKRMNEVLDNEELDKNKEKKKVSNKNDKEDYNIKFKFLEVLKEAF
ncbi:stage II sporulation protein R [Eubacterium multiforme]|uniref:Stage II sporulation protein R n=1 Tax=Eubacterium multiforme TaxID=83339 RepID=A0ABT9UQA3_9FIRM|nr:stage II sporulation protein R [Eubacterium multiforme]MDQ0148836.1 stage II sporulation protein R [Eubacterium multiforme]